VGRLIAAAAVLALVACGGKAKPRPIMQQSFGTGARQVWVFHTSDAPKSVVIFLHGLGGPGEREELPDNHLPWLRHLVREGSAVVYPRYERGPTEDPMLALLAGVERGLHELGDPKAPTVVIGFSRGGRLAVDYAAAAATEGFPPRGVLSVFPGLLGPTEPVEDLENLHPKTRIVFMVGDRDVDVGGTGAQMLLSRLQQADFPPERIDVIAVKSKAGFEAEHLAPLETTPEAKDAFWKPADRLIEEAREE
jgi:pimeloyl-ACP methyl ester carboxylesterase